MQGAKTKRNGKSEKKNSETGLQRIDSFFRKGYEKKPKRVSENSESVAKTVIELSSDDDDNNSGSIILDGAEKDLLKRSKSVLSNRNSSDAGVSSSGLLTGDDKAEDDEKRSDQCVKDLTRPRTPPTPATSIKKKPKSDDVTQTLETVQQVLDSGFKKPCASPKFQRQTQSCPTTPRKDKSNPYRRTKWENSPFKRFPIRKARSAPAKFKSLEKVDPYYLANFKFIVFSIFYDKFFDYLFNDEDRRLFTVFKNLTREAKMLYIRLFQRKRRWLQKTSIKYNEIGENLTPFFDELITMKLLENQETLVDLKEIFTLMPAPNLRDLAKEYHVSGSQTKDKSELMTILTAKCQQKTLFGGKSDVVRRKMCQKALSVLGRCYRVLPAPRAFFHRCLCLFSLTSTDEEEEANQQLYNLLQINRGAVEYPEYKEQRATKIYRDRAALVEFQEIMSMITEISDLMEKKLFDKSLVVYRRGRSLYDEYLLREEQASYESSLPSFLEPYTAGALYVRLMNQGVEILQKLRDYDEANSLLLSLLEQNLCDKYRGLWYDRLALNLDSHIKDHEQALDVIGRGLADERVRAGRRLALYQRAERICQRKSLKRFKSRLSEFHHPTLAQLPTVTIVGRKMSTLAGKITKSSFIRRSTSTDERSSHDDVIVCSVEEVALAHYRDQGYDRGIHGEGSTQWTLMMLYMWDLVFMPLPDVFYNHYQTAPLDLYTDDFYTNRREHLDERLAWIEGATMQELVDELERSWTAHQDVLCTGLQWNRFRSLDDAKSLVRCLGGKFMGGVFRRHVAAMRHCRSGVPDLIVWNTTQNTFKIVEVKGPGDHLSTKQILWLNHYLSLGADAEVCHVKGEGTKRLKKPESYVEEVD